MGCNDEEVERGKRREGRERDEEEKWSKNFSRHVREMSETEKRKVETKVVVVVVEKVAGNREGRVAIEEIFSSIMQ